MLKNKTAWDTAWTKASAAVSARDWLQLWTNLDILQVLL